ncbi:MAG TPA: apolipoprotein N-acyltransferase [Planctomycetota bacterium]|nr:apolipoprotein N-acyltransferase [Planctomycetota bacterium]
MSGGRSPSLLRPLIASLASALLLALSQPGPDLAPVTFLALVPWTLARLGPGGGARAWLADYAGGLVFFAASAGWLSHVAFVAAAIVIPVSALSFVVSGWALRRLARRLPVSLAVALAWTAGEYLRSLCPPGGFPMGILGAGLYRVPLLLQVADLGGMFLVSFLVAGVNGALAGLLAPRLGLRPRGGLRVEGACGLLALLGPAVYGGARGPTPTVEGPVVTLVQANVSEASKREVQTGGGDAEEWARSLYQAHRRLSLAAADPGDLLVWPETMLPFPLGNGKPGEVFVEAGELPGGPFHYEVADAQAAEEELVRRGVIEALRERKPHFLVGALFYDRLEGRFRLFNTAVLFSPKGERIDWYHKVHLVPGGEVLPWRRALPFADAVGRWIESWAGYFPDLAGGRGPKRFTFRARDGKEWRFGVGICWDNAYSDLFRANAREGVDFHVVLSNEAHFLDSYEMEQLLAHAAFRAVETRRAVVRATNTGITALLTPDGRVAAVLEREGRRKDVAGTLTVRVPVAERGSLFLRIGEAFPAGATAVALLLAGLLRRRGGAAESPCSA